MSRQSESAPRCRRPTLRASFAAALAATITVGMVACGSDEPDQLGKGKTKDKPQQKAVESKPSPSHTEDPKVAKAKAAALKAYRGYWKARSHALAKPDPNNTAPEKYTIDQAMGDLYATLGELKKNGRLYKGSEGHDIKISSVDFNSPPKNPHKVAIRDCLNIQHVHFLDADSREDVKPKDTLDRYVVSATVRTVGKNWRVSKVNFQVSKPC